MALPVMQANSTPKFQMARSFDGEQCETELQQLLANNSHIMERLASIAPDMPELSRLRFAIGAQDPEEAEANLREAVSWRAGEGRAIVESAAEAVSKATEGGAWDNEPVQASAPHAAIINRYITPKNILTLSTKNGDLVCVIRQSLIDDEEMMSKVSVDQFQDFLYYVKEVHLLVANARSLRTGRLCNVMFANDIKGTRKAPNARFAEAFAGKAESYEKFYPGMAGPTMLLNLPFILQAFIGLFKPFFPKSVQERLMLAQTPILAELEDLTPLSTDSSIRNTFLEEIDDLLKIS